MATDYAELFRQRQGKIDTQPKTSPFQEDVLKTAKRSGLDRAGDLLNTFNYIGAGFAEGLADGHGNLNPFVGAFQGLRSANPFGSDYTEGERSYSDVLNTLGWRPKTKLGKVARGAVGFAGDVLLDPTTYVGGGLIKGLVKGSGEVAGRKLSMEVAERTVRKNATKLGFKTEDEILQGARDLIKANDELYKLGSKAGDVTASLKHAPFGKKVFGELAEKEVKLFNKATIEGIGDKTFAPIVREARDRFMGSKLGELFSTKSALYRLGTKNPERLLASMKFGERIRGLEMSKLEKEIEIHNFFKDRGLTPAEAKELTEAMENPSVWKMIDEDPSIEIGGFDDAIEKYTGRMTVDYDKFSDPKVANIAVDMRRELAKMYENEALIGKAKNLDVESMLTYLPHMVTADAKKLFRQFDINKANGKTNMAQVFDEMGFGSKFNPYAKARQIKDIVLDGKVIKNPNVGQLNQFFKEQLKGKKAFRDDVFEVYTQRALDHNELMYDHKYTEEMMDMFGENIRSVNGVHEIQKGHKAVVNYGQMKNAVHQYASEKVHDAVEMGIDVGDDAFTKNVDELLERMGFDPDTVNNFATPMMELTDENIDAIRKVFPQESLPIKQVAGELVDDANKARMSANAKNQSELLKLFDRFTHMWKLNVTAVVPGFHARNKVSNMFQNWLAIGSDAVNPEMQVKAFKAVKNKGGFSPDDVMFINGGQGGQISWNDLYKEAKVNGIVNEGFYAVEALADDATTGLIPGLQGRFDPTDTKNFLPYKLGTKVGSTVENSDRFLHFASLKKQGVPTQDAVNSVNKFLFDYSDLTRFERDTVKRIMPFYTWLRKNIPLQLDQIIDQPKKYQMAIKATRAPQTLVDKEDRIDKRLTADFTQDWIQLPGATTNQFGRKEANLWNPSLPFQDISNIPDITKPGQALKEAVGSLNPVLKAPYEQVKNVHTYFDKPIYTEQDNELKKRIEHLARQISIGNIAYGMKDKQGVDRALQVLNSSAGAKFATYDYDRYKYYKYKDLLDEAKQ